VLTPRVQLAILKHWLNIRNGFQVLAMLPLSKQWPVHQTLASCVGGAMRSNIRLEYARVARPTRKSEALLLAAQPGR
jgi:hypothetical protein